MQTIATKLAAVKSIKQAAGWTEQELRSLIHGCGGSPRRAKRMLRADAAIAKMLAEAYANAIQEGTHHIHATKACNALYLSLVPKADAEPSDDGEGDPDEYSDEDGDEAPAAVAAPAPAPVRRARKPQAAPAADGIALLKALATDAQPALI